MSMKSKILGITFLVIAGSASAQHFRHHGHHGHWVHSGGSNWVPALIAGGEALRAKHRDYLVAQGTPAEVIEILINQ